MQPGEIVIARMRGGARIARCIVAGRGGDQVRVSVGRNREAALPSKRIALATGVTAVGHEELEKFQQRCEELVPDVDLTEVWEVVRDQTDPVTLDDLAGLLWGASHDATQKVALLLRLDRTDLYFVNDNERYIPRPQEEVQHILDRRAREEENARAASSLMDHLSRGELPPEMTQQQANLLEFLRGYAVHGDNYTRSASARQLLEMTNGLTGDLQRFSFELLVKAGVFEPHEPLELERAGIPTEFPNEVLHEASTIEADHALQQPGRRDLTHMIAVTVDDAGTEDRDDAISLEPELPQNGALPSSTDGVIYRVGVHIADAGALIPLQGAVDREADRRMATLYLPERRVHMLPPSVTNEKGSLEPGEGRASLSLLARVTEDGEVVDWEVKPSVIRSRAALSYEEVDNALDDSGHPWHEMLSSMGRIAQLLTEKRNRAGAITVERPEMIVKLADDDEVEVRVISRATPARQMVAEFMILCNSLLAEFCRREGIPAAYRSQAVPDLSDVAQVAEGPLRRFLTMRRLLPADVNTTPSPHGGLGVPAYIQATSPLRRYPDLVLQRQISHFLENGRPLYSTEEISSVAQRAEVQLRELTRLEEDRRRYWFLTYLKRRLARDNGAHALFEAVVLENQPRRPALLELADYPFRVRAGMPTACLPGDTVTLRLHGVDTWARVPHFVHEPHP